MDTIMLFFIIFFVAPCIVFITMSWFCDKKDKESEEEVRKPKTGNYLKTKN